ncbi:ABC transporter substrate-binding protein [Methylobacterium nonmethylotrophicum]|uniref:ABC transporter substrate-binding protein n=1 Tax=Methylobacterium nonmethylotrophicum TaxID=1141884 RepID=A0A4Z0NLR9_9HYPH|nr:ABC transporter substrate-binding protein [Methylobacterium nonmethylotrophicum]TGD97405.1 ABC transporter substrate-binding protein [Methylobacterium nonmethylotrophicum]
MIQSPARRAFVAGFLAAGTVLSGAGPSLAQQKSEIAITRQPGIIYLPTHVIEKQGLIEKHAERLGVPGVKTKWITFSGGGSQTDALLAGGVDIVNTGTGNLLLLWDRTRGGVKGIVATSALPLLMVTRDPKIQTIKDIAPGDKIAVPTVKVSTQAILLQMAAGELWGPDQSGRLDANTVQLGHPDAAIALSNPTHEIRTHFAAPPFQYVELRNVPGARIVARSPDIIGGPLTQGQFFTTTKFADANPKIVQAVRAASEEAQAFIRQDTRQAVEIYREVTGDKTSVEDLLSYLGEPGMMEFNLQPQGTMRFAEHLGRIGTLRTKPKAWTDYYLPVAHDLSGS